MNWVNPLIWPHIDNAMIAEGRPWSRAAIVRRLQNQDPDMFATLRPQRISDWRDHSYKDGFRWKDSHLVAVARGNSAPAPSPKGSVLVSKLIFTFASVAQDRLQSSHPQLSTTIQLHLKSLRAAGVALQVGSIRGYMVGVIKHKAPEIFIQKNRSGKPYELSSSSVRRFLREELGWSPRRSTRPAQKFPPNVDTVLLKAFFRFACLIRDEAIPPCCIVNADQTQVVYSAGSGSTWNRTGERQVSVLGADEKRAFTLMVGVAMSGHLLPPQAIYAGKTTRSVPDSLSPGYARSCELGFRFLPSMKSTYWSTLSTMQLYISEHLAPFFLEQIRTNNLPDGQRCVFQIDCWSVHRSAEFRAWMSTHYPWIILQYVPGGCTGLFQACDVGIQRILKLAIRHACHEDIVEETLELLEAHVPASEIVNDSTLKTLRDRSVRWILAGYDAVNDVNLIQKVCHLTS